MLTNASTINGYAIAAEDGKLGTVSDFLFDDASWRIRWLVVDTGNWLPGREVLLPPFVLGHIDEDKREFAVRLTMKQVEGSPEINLHRPVSRQMETDMYDYYGWSPYWGTGFYMGGYGYAPSRMLSTPALGTARLAADVADERRQEDPHLRSTASVSGYHIHATDGEIGHVQDFLLEEADWSIHYLIVDTKNWWPGAKVLISPRSVRVIDWTNGLINLDIDRQRVKSSPAYDPSMTVDRLYEKRFHSHYDEVGAKDRF
jgi:sporulation protein YlmC with PRC-barrel domain